VEGDEGSGRGQVRGEQGRRCKERWEEMMSGGG
jgi:hypothetical protein